MQLRAAAAKVVPPLALVVVPVIVFVLVFRIAYGNGSFAIDFHNEIYPEAQELVKGHDPFPTPTADLSHGSNHIWPPVVGYLAAPLTLLSPKAADIVMVFLGVACFGAALWTVGVRDWRVYGASALWPPVMADMRTAHLSLILCLLVAVVWRARARTALAGLTLGLAIALKFFVWPLVLWLASLRRWREAGIAAATAAASLLLLLPFIGILEYARLLRRLGAAYDQNGFTPYGFFAQAGAPSPVARTLTLAIGIALLAIGWRRRSFALFVAAALVLSPIVWLDYLALTAVPLAVVRPTFSWIWLLPVVTWGVMSSGTLPDMVRVLAVFTGIVWYTERRERRCLGHRRTSLRATHCPEAVTPPDASTPTLPLSRRREDVVRALHRVAPPILLGVVPLLSVLIALSSYSGSNSIAFDFHHELYPEAKLVVHGHDPYPAAGEDLSGGTNNIWPIAAVIPVTPLTLLRPAVADWTMTFLVLASLAGALWILGVRDWRVYGVALLWPPVISAYQTANVTLPLCLLCAIAWRVRHRTWLPGVVIGSVAGGQVLPLAARRSGSPRSDGCAPSVTSVALAGRLAPSHPAVHRCRHVRQPPPQRSATRSTTGGTRSTRLLRRRSESHLWPSARRRPSPSEALMLAVAWRRRSFGLAIGAALVLSPIVWLHFVRAARSCRWRSRARGSSRRGCSRCLCGSFPGPGNGSTVADSPRARRPLLRPRRRANGGHGHRSRGPVESPPSSEPRRHRTADGRRLPDRPTPPSTIPRRSWIVSSRSGVDNSLLVVLVAALGTMLLGLAPADLRRRQLDDARGRPGDRRARPSAPGVAHGARAGAHLDRPAVARAARLLRRGRRSPGSARRCCSTSCS